MSEILLSEDLAVWFGKKKKPKGSSQPKGPWVNICSRDKDGKHPPCGRPDADSKSYPKCRAAGVASKMTDSQKKAACAQKRREEKKDPKVGKGNKPTMTQFDEQKTKKMIISITEDQFERLFEFNEETPVLLFEDEFGSIEKTNLESTNMLNEAEYQGRKVQLGKIMQGDIKKFKVYVKNDKGKVVKVNFGFGGKSAKGKRMVIKKNNPERRKSFRARHNCENPGPRWKPRYWACRTW